VAQTPIRCKRCGTLTTWTPYCPGCGAYLEFAGDPPWVPKPELTDQPADVSSGASSGATTQQDLDESQVVGAPDPTEIVVSAIVAGPATLPVHDRKSRRRIGGVAPWWRFWGRHQRTVVTAPDLAIKEDVTLGAVIESGDEFLPIVNAPDVPELVAAESPARQEELQRRTLSIGRSDDLGVIGGEPCPRCRFRNYVDATYCARCGFPLQAIAPAVRTSESALKRSDDAPRRTDWTFMVVATLVIAIVLGILFSPLGAPIRNGSTNLLRSFAYWIDPGTGTPVTLTDVTASSTGYGNPAIALGFVDLTTFWASAPSSSWGAGTELTFTLEAPTVIDRMVIRPGIQNGQFAVRALATPANLTLTFVELSSPTESSSPTVTPSPTASPSPNATPSPTASPSPNATPSPTASSSPNATPSPTATPTVKAALPMVVETGDWTNIITFPAVYTQVIVVRVDSIFPPALPDVYDPEAGGQVAISNITFLPLWKPSDLFNFTFQYPSTPAPSSSPTSTPSGTPSPSSQSQQTSPSPSPSG
jgi:ribosomal protein L37E